MLGFYARIMPEDEFKFLQENPVQVEELFLQLARERLVAWIDLIETRLKGTGIRCFVTGGNDDDPKVLDVLKRQATEALVACEGEVVQMDDDHSMVSVGYSNPTPWKTPREVPDEKLAEFIQEMVSRVKDYERCIFNFHVPPLNSTLDTCPKLDWSTDPPTPIMMGGQIVMDGAGSQAVRKAIETCQPMLALHGHIHESSGVIKIGRTTCINPGSEYGEGILRGCLVTFSDGKVEGFQMTSG